MPNNTTMIRKTRSLGCVRATSLSGLTSWTVRSSPHGNGPRSLASKFSNDEVEKKEIINPNDNHYRDFQSLDDLSVDGVDLSLNNQSPETTMSEPQAHLANTRSSRVVFYLSLMTLIVATVSNSSVHKVCAKIHRSSPKLGPAAISSLTDALSPILPFAGGSDLRRVGEYSIVDLLPTGTFDSWEMFYGSSLKQRLNLSNVVNLPRGGAAEVKQKLSYKDIIAIRKKQESTPAILGGSVSFISSQQVADLTLKDVTDIFQYAIESNREGFDEAVFFTSLSSRTLNVIQIMEDAISRARREGVLPAQTMEKDEEFGISKAGYGDIDALLFCAAMRILGDWRILRQVPEGYKGYAVGMSLGHKDIIQNVAKIESAVNGWIEERRETMRLQSMNGHNSSFSLGELRSPTLRELLLSEISLSLHNLPRLKDKSAAMGLLWVRRQLHYQTATFANVRSKSFHSVEDAVVAAYREVYDAFHGWAVQKIFTYSFKAAPQAEEIYRTMNPEHLTKVFEKAQTLGDEEKIEMVEVRIDEPQSVTQSDETDNIEDSTIQDERTNVHTPESMSEEQHEELEGSSHQNTSDIKHNDNIFLKLGTNVSNEWNKFGKHFQKEWDKFANAFVTKHSKIGRSVAVEWNKLGDHIHGEWDKLIGNLVRHFEHKKERTDFETDVRGGGRQGSNLEGEELENYINEEMSRIAYHQIGIYLEVAKPLLKDLAGLFEEMNMDDPTKV